MTESTINPQTDDASSPIDLTVRTTRICTGAHLVAVTGQLARHSAPRLRQELDRLPGSGDVVVDLQARVLDPIMLGVVLLGASRSARAVQRQMIVVCDQDPLLRLLHRAGVHAHLRLERSLDDALRYVFARVLLEQLRRA